VSLKCSLSCVVSLALSTELTSCYDCCAQTGAFLRAKLCVRFLGELVNCRVIRASEFGDLLTTLVHSYVSVEDAAVAQLCRDLITSVVIGALPWCGATLHAQWRAGLSDLMELVSVS
jgi:hypothetical protein